MVMEFIQAVVLAVVQGVTEFLPISSSGHLILAPAIMGWKDQGVLTDVVTHVGSLLAVVIYFWRDMMGMTRGSLDILKGRTTYNSQLLINVIVGTIPIIIVGFILKLSGLSDSMRLAELVAINAIIFGLLLYFADRYGLMLRGIREMNWVSALIIGAAQCLSLSPGTSRSGITMTAARALGFTRPEAARFSFLLSVPANAAAAILVIGESYREGHALTGIMVLTGVLTFFVALATIHFLMQMLRTMSFLPFVIYRVILGVVLLGLIYSGVPLGTVN